MHNFSPTIERLIAARGVTPDEYDEFFDPSLKRLARAEDMPGVADAVRVILPFVRARRKIVVFGDYDCDGVCASAILVTTLRRIGGVAEAVLPNRFTEGYGLTAAAIGRLFREHPDVALMITVDNGITAAAEIAAIRARGVAVVVTDHHLPPPDAVPEADAMVETKIAAAPGCEDLCGAGVAFFLAAALARAAAAEKLYAGGSFSGPLLVMAGLATVADLMPLRKQNRILVAQALKLFSAAEPLGAPVGLKELLERSVRRAAAITSRDFGFALAPRINAAGRMKSADAAYSLLMATERELARNLAFEVDSRNAERKTEEQSMADEVRARAAAEAETLGAVVAHDENWHVGVAGIVAARLVEETHVPAAVSCGGHGSARAPDGYNVHDALSASAAALDRFGGHAAAGGFSVKAGMFEEFKRLFAAACRVQREANAAAVERLLRPEPEVWLEPADLTLDLLNEVDKLQPFGEGNPEPVFGLRAVRFADARPVGADGRHASFSFVNRKIPRAVWWGHGEDAENVRMHSAAAYDVLFTLISSDYGTDVPHLELRLVDVRAS